MSVRDTQIKELADEFVNCNSLERPIVQVTIFGSPWCSTGSFKITKWLLKRLGKVVIKFLIRQRRSELWALISLVTEYYPLGRYRYDLHWQASTMALYTFCLEEYDEVWKDAYSLPLIIHVVSVTQRASGKAFMQKYNIN